MSEACALAVSRRPNAMPAAFLHGSLVILPPRDSGEWSDAAAAAPMNSYSGTALAMYCAISHRTARQSLRAIANAYLGSHACDGGGYPSLPRGPPRAQEGHTSLCTASF